MTACGEARSISEKRADIRRWMGRNGRNRPGREKKPGERRLRNNRRKGK